MLERWASQRELDAFLIGIEAGSVLLDCGEQDFPRIRQLIARYADMPLGFADAAVVACAERRGGLVLTYDQRHFPVVAREGTIRIAGA
jgi:predicted nucleic acid-binding protein